MTQYDHEPTLEITVLAPSAGRHGISEERIRAVVAWCPLPYHLPDPITGRGDLVLFLGPDPHGVPLEIVARDPGDGRLTVFHAMKMRPGYRALFEQVMRCR
jgi:hypothetical protein